MVPLGKYRRSEAEEEPCKCHIHILILRGGKGWRNLGGGGFYQ